METDACSGPSLIGFCILIGFCPRPFHMFHRGESIMRQLESFACGHCRLSGLLDASLGIVSWSEIRSADRFTVHTKTDALYSLCTVPSHPGDSAQVRSTTIILVGLLGVSILYMHRRCLMASFSASVSASTWLFPLFCLVSGMKIFVLSFPVLEPPGYPGCSRMVPDPNHAALL